MLATGLAGGAVCVHLPPGLIGSGLLPGCLRSLPLARSLRPLCRLTFLGLIRRRLLSGRCRRGLPLAELLCALCGLIFIALFRWRLLPGGCLRGLPLADPLRTLCGLTLLSLFA